MNQLPAAAPINHQQFSNAEGSLHQNLEVHLIDELTTSDAAAIIMKAQQHFRSPGLIYTKCCRRRALSIIKDSTNPLVHAQSLGADTVALDQGQHTDVLTRVCELLIGTDCTVSLLQYFYPFTIHNIYFILLHIFSPFIKRSYLLVYYFTKCTTVWLMCFVCKA